MLTSEARSETGRDTSGSWATPRGSARAERPTTTEGPHGAGPRGNHLRRRALLVVVRDVELGKLLGEAGVAAAGADLLQRGEVLVEGGAEAAQAVAVAEPELGGDLVLVEQADVVHGPRERLGGLDLDPPVALEARGGRDQLADDHVLLQAVEGVLLALERGVRQDLRRLLEGGGRQERVRVQRGLRDAEDDLLVLRGLAARVLDPRVLTRELVAVDELARQVGRVTLLVDADLLEHLADDQLDVLVVDVHALGLVDLLHLLDEVALGLGPAAELEQVVRVQRALVELAARVDVLALGHEQARPARERVAVLLARVVGHDHGEGLVGLLDVDDAGVLGDLREALRLARLEELHDARQAVRDVRAGDAAGVERPHGQLRARLADRLRGDDADRVADLGRLPGRHRAAVAGLAHAGHGLALEDRPDGHPGIDVEVLVDVCELRAVDEAALLDDDAAALRRDLRGGEPADEVVVRVAGRGADRELDVALGAAVRLADDHVLRDVDQAPGEVARVGGAQRGVGEALARAVRRDEVLEHGQALHEVGLDRALDDLALRVGHEAAHAGELADLAHRASRAGRGHHHDRVRRVEVLLHRAGDLVGRLRPLLDDELVALLLRDQAHVVLVLDLGDLALVALEDLLLLRRDHDVVLRDRDAGQRRVAEAEVLERVEHERDRGGTVELDELVDELDGVLLLHRLVDELVARLLERVAERVLDRPLDAVVVDDAPDRREDVAALTPDRPVLGQGVELDLLLLVEQLRLLRRAEHVRARLVLGPLARAEGLLALGQLGRVRAVRQVVGAEHHVLRRRRERRAVRRRQDVVAREHEDPRLRLRLGAQREVDRHLVAVEVRVERVADERVDLDGLALDEHRLERLDAQAVERRRAVEQDRVLVDDLLEDVPDLGDHRVDHLLGRLDVLRVLALDELSHDEGLEQLERHELRQAALVQLQRRARHDHGPAGVVDALAEEVLAEAALLALKHVGERLQRPVARAGDGAPAAAVVEQGVDGLLEHPLLVVDDDLGRAEVEQPLEAVVAVDDAPVEVVEVGRREPAAVELDHRAQLRRDDRDGLEDHHLRLVAGVQE